MAEILKNPNFQMTEPIKQEISRLLIAIDHAMRSHGMLLDYEFLHPIQSKFMRSSLVSQLRDTYEHLLKFPNTDSLQQQINNLIRTTETVHA